MAADPSQSPKLKICVLWSSYEGSNAATKEWDAPTDPSKYDTTGKYEWTTAPIHRARAVQQILALSQGYDVFMNLCDGTYDDDRAGKEVVEALERFGCAYTGADVKFYEPTKVLMKKVAYYHGVNTPAHASFGLHDLRPTDDVVAAQQCAAEVQGLRWPLIVKHHSGYSSVGMGPDCKVENMQDLLQQVRQCLAEFDGALVEEFIAGREFTVLVAENPHGGPEQPLTVHTPVECIFSEGETFKHFDLKWRDYDRIHWQPLDGQAEPQLDAALREAAGKMFTAMGGVSYGRCDFRVDEQGNVFFLEINPNCGIFYPPEEKGSADFILSLDQQHGGHAGFIDAIVEAALQRAQARKAARVVQVRCKPGSGYGLYAKRPLSAGDVVVRYEQQPHVLVSLDHVKRCWPPSSDAARWFDAYAWPVSDSVWVTWSDDPDDWLPINHSCDPNCWLQGLDAVARRPIAAGEQITMEYATFCGPNMAPFDCTCGTAACRGRVSGSDFLAEWLDELYGEHVSGYVAAARRKKGLLSEPASRAGSSAFSSVASMKLN